MDRNISALESYNIIVKSLSARRAWIEISKIWYCGTSIGSLSARRAWIEMQVFQRIAKPFRSLSARRAWIEIDFAGSAWVSEFRRSPQGERG